jgi:hypothetical protein
MTLDENFVQALAPGIRKSGAKPGALSGTPRPPKERNSGWEINIAKIEILVYFLHVLFWACAYAGRRRP